MTAQGGGDCVSPVGEPRAAMLNVTIVPGAFSGFLKVYPSNVAPPPASFVNYRPFTQVANAGTIQTGFMVNRDIEVFASTDTDVVIDVMGYYAQPGTTAPDSQRISAQVSVPALSSNSVQTGVCPTGYTLVSCGAGDLVGTNLELTFVTTFGSDANPTSCNCGAQNPTATAQTLFCNGICLRLLGR